MKRKRDDQSDDEAETYAGAYGAEPQTDEELEGVEAELRDVSEEPW